MKNSLTFIVICLLFVGNSMAQNGQNIAIDFAKKDKKITLKGLKMGKTGAYGVGSFTTADLAVDLKDPEPFIAFSMRIGGNNLAALSITVQLQTEINGKWLEWTTIEANHDVEQNAELFVSNMHQIDKTTAHIRLKITNKSLETSFKSVNIRLFAPGNMPAGDASTSTPEGLCAKPAAVSRSVWGARWSLKDDSIYIGTPTITNVTHLVVHHSGDNYSTSNWAAIVASFFDYHTTPKPNGNGWSDIGYNYLVAPDGTLFVGRGGGDNVQGAHMCSRNENTMGVCVIGNYVSTPPTTATLDKLTQILAWKASQRGIDVLGTSALAGYGINLANLCGHSDGCGSGYTECPGDLLWAQLPTIRQRVKAAVTTCTTATNDLFTEGSFRIAPNPSNGQFQISAVLKEKMDGLPLILSVYGLDGKAIFEEKIDNSSLDFSQNIQLPNVAKGVYLVRLRSGDKAFSEKIQVF